MRRNETIKVNNSRIFSPEKKFSYLFEDNKNVKRIIIFSVKRIILLLFYEKHRS